ncbi:tRNA(His) guanylyltransferase Thg1 family protein [Actinosynnema sp. NPDC091369]
MRWAEFEAGQRAREWFHGLTAPVGLWTVVRVDGRAFTRFTEERFDKPFDAGFSRLMVETAQALLTELGARYAYTESDEISVVLDPRHDLFGRGVEKVVSISAGIASAAFTHAAGTPAHFDSRIWLGAGTADVIDYVSWRQADATRCALNGWCYWTLRKAGASRQEATAGWRAPVRRTRTSCCSSTASPSPSCPPGSGAASACGGPTTAGPATTPCAGSTSPPPGGTSTSSASCR